LFFGSNNNNFIGFTTKSTNNYKFTLSGVDHTAIGYHTNEQQLVVDSNGIKVNTGTVNANSLTLGTNILSSDLNGIKINSSLTLGTDILSSDLLFFLNKLKENMQYDSITELVQFTNTLLIAGINKEQSVTIDNGNIEIKGIANNGITIGGNKISSIIWGKLGAIFSGNNTYTGNNTFNRLTSITNKGQGPYLRTQQYFISDFTVFNESAFGINQLIILQPSTLSDRDNDDISQPRFTGIQIPRPETCQGQTLHIHHRSDRILSISAVQGSNFSGKKSGNSFNMVFNDVVILQSSYYNWNVFSA
jgi:hypothetical protein